MGRNAASIAGHFDLSGDVNEVVPVTTGHINDTCILTMTAGGCVTRYVLQRINHHVFKDPPRMMVNIRRITEHIRTALSEVDPAMAVRQLRVIPTRDGQDYYHDTGGNFWRIYAYIENATTYDTASSVTPAREAARMFGLFQKLLRDLPGPALYETIPGFHDTPGRLECFREVVRKDAFDRARKASREIDFVLENAAICTALPNRMETGDLPIRIAHNDAKINNVMLDENTGRGVCLIDLDTVMPGLSVYDFGDLVRTAACRAQEDERDLSKVTVDLSLFEALAQGFAEPTHEWLTAVEKNHLVFGGILITFEQLVRFLTDYLAGDTYYKVRREDHNLDRSRTQMKLVQSMIDQKEAMHERVEKAFRDLRPGDTD